MLPLGLNFEQHARHQEQCRPIADRPQRADNPLGADAHHRRGQADIFIGHGRGLETPRLARGQDNEARGTAELAGHDIPDPDPPVLGKLERRVLRLVRIEPGMPDEMQSVGPGKGSEECLFIERAGRCHTACANGEGCFRRTVGKALLLGRIVQGDEGGRRGGGCRASSRLMAGT